MPLSPMPGGCLGPAANIGGLLRKASKIIRNQREKNMIHSDNKITEPNYTIYSDKITEQNYTISIYLVYL